MNAVCILIHADSKKDLYEQRSPVGAALAYLYCTVYCICICMHNKESTRSKDDSGTTVVNVLGTEVD